MATRCVKDWLAMATRWQEEQGTLASLLDQIQAAPQLITFLQGLKIDLKNIVSFNFSVTFLVCYSCTRDHCL